MTDLTTLRRQLAARREAKVACELLAKQVPELGLNDDPQGCSHEYLRASHADLVMQYQCWIEEAEERIEAAEGEQGVPSGPELEDGEQ